MLMIKIPKLGKAIEASHKLVTTTKRAFRGHQIELGRGLLQELNRRKIHY